jgi:alkyl hydroperoxide reductase subunit AhpF
MALIDDAVAGELRQAFAALVHPVRLAVFSDGRPRGAGSEAEDEVRQLVAELAALDPRLTVEAHGADLEGEPARELGIERGPAIAVLGERIDHGVRFYGLPEGYEFGTLVEAVLDVSRGDSGLAAETRAVLAGLESDVRIRVFSTPT